MIKTIEDLEEIIGKFVSFNYADNHYDKALVTKEGDYYYLLNNCHSNADSHSNHEEYAFSYIIKDYSNFRQLRNLKLIKEEYNLIYY